MSEFVAFARSHGLLIDHAPPDGRVHRCRTEAKPRKRNGAFLFDGRSGWVQDWTIHPKAIGYRIAGDVEVRRIDRGALARQERARRDEAAWTARDIILRSELTTHPYLAAKGFPLWPGLVDGGKLIVPMRSFERYRERIYSVQMIDADGSKKFLPGGRAKGAVYRIGTGFDVWLVEGYATALSVHAALESLYRKAEVWVCFSAGNLQHVARHVACRIFADHDSSGTGQQVAADSGRAWVMSPVAGEDANDLHQRAGVRAVAELMRSVM